MRNMGGLKSYMPITFWLMWIATLAIAGVPLFAGFFSKDEILGSAFARAHGSALSEATLLGISGSAWLYLVYIFGLAAAFLTAVYMTRMMLYTFHGPNRTGETERQHLHEAPWVMTGPLVVLGILSAFGGWLNLPKLIPIGPVGLLDHWLEPVVGASTARVAAVAGGAQAAEASSSEAMLIGLAVLVGIAGIAFAWMRLKPDRLVPKSQSQPETGFDRVLEHKYYVDEAYDRAIVRPTVDISRGFLWRFVDAGIIDNLFVNGSAAVARAFGWVGSRLQSGALGTYAWVLVAGVLAVLGAVTLR
jgi:NADH-quinone oxidoreductase subunit L